MFLRAFDSSAGKRLGLASLVRAFCSCAAVLEKPLPPRLVIPETDITEAFLKGTGPGGQKINKTSSAVQLKHLPTGIVVKSQETRSREQNRRTARRILAEKLEELEKGAQSRTAIKAERARKKKASASKKARRKYRKLESDKAAARRDDEYPAESGTHTNASASTSTNASANANANASANIHVTRTSMNEGDAQRDAQASGGLEGEAAGSNG